MKVMNSKQMYYFIQNSSLYAFLSFLIIINDCEKYLPVIMHVCSFEKGLEILFSFSELIYIFNSKIYSDISKWASYDGMIRTPDKKIRTIVDKW